MDTAPQPAPPAAQQPAPPTAPHPLPPPFATNPTLLTPISQGAEAHLYATTFLSASRPAALKYRPPKPYRHPLLDARLTRARILAEARILLRCVREGVPVPALLAAGPEEGWLLLAWVGGGTVKEVLRGLKVGAGGSTGGQVEVVRGVLGKVGRAVGRLHAAGVVHGDLTSSNMILRPGGEGRLPGQSDGALTGKVEEDGEIVLIDFGLAQMGSADEERAVDLYVLERAFGSTHPELESVFEQEVLGAYGQSYKGAKVVLKRLEDVRMRGRKKSMIG